MTEEGLRVIDLLEKTIEQLRDASHIEQSRLLIKCKVYVEDDDAPTGDSFDQWLSTAKRKADAARMKGLDTRDIEIGLAILEAERDLAVTSSLAVEAQSIDPTFCVRDDAKQRISDLCYEMRSAIAASDVFDEPHKARLLKRVHQIEIEVLLPKGRFDVILAGMSDFGEALGKFGEDVKPLVDRMKEITKIARSGSGDYRGLPAPEEAKSLPAPDEDGEKKSNS